MITTDDAGGVLEFVRDEETGFVVGADPREIADRIDRLAGSSALCKRLGEAGHDSIAGISWDAVIRRLVGACG